MNDLQNNIETRSMLPVGTVLNGKYRIDRYLASGGFGNTYAAYNVFLEEEVAVKEFYIRGVTQRDGDSVSVSVSNEENLTQFIDQKTKFMKEARRLRRLKNDHIVRVHDLFEENGTAYYIMDFVNGESLSSRLKRTGQPIGEQESLNILGQVLDALAVVHQQGIFHLDIKPANIMVDHEGNALLIDFGASKQIKQEGGATTSTGLCYTPGYAPIEQMTQNFNQFGPWTDIYSLGASLYYMLTLHPLPSPADLLENEILLQMDDTVSPRTQQLVRRMMAPVRTQRPQSVAEVKCLLAEKIVDDPTQIVTKSEPPSEITRTIAKPQPQPVPPPLPQPKPQPTAPHTLSEKTMSPVGGSPGATKPPQPKPQPEPKPQLEPEPVPADTSQHLTPNSQSQSSGSSRLWWAIGIAVGIVAVIVVCSILTLVTADTETIKNSVAPVDTETINVSVAPVDILVSDVIRPDPSSDDEIVQKAIAKFLKGDKGAVRFTERAKRDLYESTWPEVCCSVEGMLDSPASFRDLVVKKVGPDLYKYECVCPDHGDRYIDCCTMSAHIASDGVVEIEGVKWDNAR